MKIIFLKDVPRIGIKNQVKEVNDGYAINFLFPKKLAVLATPKKIKEFEKLEKNIKTEKEIEEKLLDKELADIEGKEVIIEAKAGESGSLFSSIHKKDIVSELKKQHHIQINEDIIVLDKVIKKTGEHNIKIKIKKKESFLKIKIIPSL